MRQRLLVGGVIACLLLALLVRFVYLPIMAKMGEQRAMLRDLQVKHADAQGLAAQLSAQEAAVQQARERSRALERRIDAGQSMARILETLKLQAEQHELELTAVKPRAEEHHRQLLSVGPELTLRETPLTLQLTGSYQQLGEFLGGLANAPFRAFTRTLTVTKPEAGSAKLRADLVLAVYLAERPSSP